MDKAKLIEELSPCSKEDLEFIEANQQDLYTPEEMDVVREMIRLKEKEEQEEQNAFIQAHLPKEITCPKCDGVNAFSNDTCCYCGYHFDKRKYYQVSYYADNNENEEEEKGSSYAFQYIISFLIPIVGFILGAILMSKDSFEEKSVGKACIILGIISMVVTVAVLCFWLGSLFF